MMKTHPNAVLGILNRLYKRKSGSLFAKQGTNLKMIKAFQCLQEEIIKAYGEKLEFTDLMLVSSTGQLEALSKLVAENAQSAHEIETRAARKFKFKTAPANRLRLGGKDRSEKRPCGNTTREYHTLS